MLLLAELLGWEVDGHSDGASDRTSCWWELETNIWQILIEELEPKGLPQIQTLKIWMPQELPELSERAPKETVSTKHENNCPQLLVGLLFSDCSCGELLLNSILYVSLKAFQRGSEKAGCTLVNWKLFVTKHPSPSLNIHHQKEVRPQGQEARTRSAGAVHIPSHPCLSRRPWNHICPF